MKIEHERTLQPAYKEKLTLTHSSQYPNPHSPLLRIWKTFSDLNYSFYCILAGESYYTYVMIYILSKMNVL